MMAKRASGRAMPRPSVRLRSHRWQPHESLSRIDLDGGRSTCSVEPDLVWTRSVDGTIRLRPVHVEGDKRSVVLLLVVHELVSLARHGRGEEADKVVRRGQQLHVGDRRCARGNVRPVRDTTWAMRTHGRTLDDARMDDARRPAGGRRARWTTLSVNEAALVGAAWAARPICGEL